MTEEQALALRERLLAHRDRLLDRAAQQAEADNLSLDWLHMVADVQAALTAVEEATLLASHTASSTTEPDRTDAKPGLSRSP